MNPSMKIGESRCWSVEIMSRKHESHPTGQPVTQQALAQTVRSFDAFLAAAGLNIEGEEARYQRALAIIDAILQATRDTPAREQAEHPLAPLLDYLTLVAREYESRQEPMAFASAREVLRFLMEQHQLKQSDLPEIGSQGVVSQILSGKRQLNARQIAALSARFGVASDAFMAPGE